VLVYLKEPMGYSTICGRRVYGQYYSYGRFGATAIPRAAYFENKDKLEEAEITKDWLEGKTGCKFPPVSFKTTELGKLDFDVVIKIARGLGIKYIRNRKITTEEKKALNRAIVHFIEKLQGV
jgi:hypothetical protein